MHGYLTFDVGTTAVKSCLFDDDLRLLSIANEEYTLDTDAGGRVELDPERYWQAVCGGAAEALLQDVAETAQAAAAGAKLRCRLTAAAVSDALQKSCAGAGVIAELFVFYIRYDIDAVHVDLL